MISLPEGFRINVPVVNLLFHAGGSVGIGPESWSARGEAVRGVRERSTRRSPILVVDTPRHQGAGAYSWRHVGRPRVGASLIRRPGWRRSSARALSESQPAPSKDGMHVPEGEAPLPAAEGALSRASRICLAARLRPHRRPRARSSAWTRGNSQIPPLLAWTSTTASQGKRGRGRFRGRWGERQDLGLRVAIRGRWAGF